ncbi:MAG: NAD(P)H-binding protein [Deltaproteobacteria bacterium]|nr:NAD(P)H-binding protein [Deltaproteobacteria bacterium]
MTTSTSKRVCIVGASGKLGRYMIRHCLDRGYEVVGVCRPESVGKLADFEGQICIEPGRTDDREVIARAVRGCDGVLTVLVPFGVRDYSSGTAGAVLDLAEPGARLVFSCGWHITRDGKDVYSLGFRLLLTFFTWLARLLRFADIDDQVRACDRIFASDRDWTVVRGSDLEEGESEGLPVWSEHVGDPILASNRTRRVDFARFMVHALTDEALVRKVPAIVSRQSASALSYSSTETVSLA